MPGVSKILDTCYRATLSLYISAYTCSCIHHACEYPGLVVVIFYLWDEPELGSAILPDIWTPSASRSLLGMHAATPAASLYLGLSHSPLQRLNSGHTSLPAECALPSSPGRWGPVVGDHSLIHLRLPMLCCANC